MRNSTRHLAEIKTHCIYTIALIFQGNSKRKSIYLGMTYFQTTLIGYQNYTFFPKYSSINHKFNHQFQNFARDKKSGLLLFVYRISPLGEKSPVVLAFWLEIMVNKNFKIRSESSLGCNFTEPRDQTHLKQQTPPTLPSTVLPTQGFDSFLTTVCFFLSYLKSKLLTEENGRKLEI